MSRVLVVDDEFDLLETVRAILEAEGYDVEVAANGRQALEQLVAGDPPDVLLVDVMMPILGGFELLEELDKIPAMRQVPVVMMSAAQAPARRRGIGWRAFLRKPFTLDALVGTVRKVDVEPEARRRR